MRASSPHCGRDVRATSIPMHIPDGYLSPASAGTLYAFAAPFWYIASRKVQRLFSTKTIPLMALMSAFCFVIQMINVPLPGGTTGHAVGAGLAAIVLTPWPAVIAISVSLIIQALFFGDGGITAIGANCLNMAIVQVFVSYFLYRLFATSTPRGKAISAGVAAYIGLNISGLLAGIELGLQPMIASGPEGTPLYAPYPMNVAIPAMLFGHLFAGIAEALITGTAIAFIHKSAPDILKISQASEKDQVLPEFWIRVRLLWILIAFLTILTPLGLLAPGTPWGEWSSEQLRGSGLGFVPEGMRKLEGFWNAQFADYTVPGLGVTSGYVASAVLGVILIVLVFAGITFLGKKLSQRKMVSR